MARPVNYDEKIAKLEKKITKKKEDIKKLKGQLSELQERKANEGAQQLQEYMKKNNMSVIEALAILAEVKG